MDKRRDFYDYLSDDLDDIIYDRQESISLAKDCPDIFDPLSNRLSGYKTYTSTLIVIKAGSLMKRSFVRDWEKSGNKVSSSIHTTLNNLRNFDIEKATFAALKHINLEPTKESPLIVCAIDIDPDRDFEWKRFMDSLIVIKNPIIFGSVLEYVLSAKELYYSIEDYLLCQ